MNKLQKKYKPCFEIAAFILGAAIFSAGVSIFITPANIAVGGFTGISIIINHLLRFPTGILIIILNVPIALICAYVFGIKFILRTAAGVILTSVFIDLFALFPPFENISYELSALFGGVLQGIGLGLVYLNGFTTGGTDLVLWLLKLKFPNMTSGFIIFILDSIVVGISALILRDLESVLYSAITIFVYTRVIDTILGVTDRANLALIISRKYDEIADRIDKTLERGTTILDGKGWFTKEEKKIILCVIDRSQLYTLRSLISEIDPEAFSILTDAREVVGRGFKEFKRSDKDKKIGFRKKKGKSV